MDAAPPTPTPSSLEREPLSLGEIREVWPLLAHTDRIEGSCCCRATRRRTSSSRLSARDQADLLLGMPARERRSWMRLLAPGRRGRPDPGGAAEQREALLALLDEPTRREVTALLAYAEDDAGGLMNPRFARVRPEMTVDEAISYLRKQSASSCETIYYAYVLDAEQQLLGVVSFRELFTAAAATARRATSCSTRGRHRPRGHGPGGGEPHLRASTTWWPCRWSTPRGA